MTSCSSALDMISASAKAGGRRLSIRDSRPDSAPLELEVSPDDAAVIPMVAAYLYAHYYAYDANLQDGDYLMWLGLRVSDRGFLRALSDVNPGHGYFSEGW